MAIPYNEASMALVRAVDGTYISYPFIESGDTSTRVYKLSCTQRGSDYNAAQIDLDDNMGSANNAGVINLPTGWADSNAFFVGDTGHSPVGGGMISFTRTFANIPQSINIASGSEFFTFPGIWKPRTAGDTKGVTSISTTAGTRGVTLSHLAPGVSIGSNIQASLSYTVGTDPFVHTVNGSFRVLGASTNTTRIDIGHYWSGPVALNGSGSFIPGDLFRTEESKNVATKTRYDYLLPGVTPGISNSIDINLPPPFSVITGTTGEATKLVSDGDTIDTIEVLETIPTATAYLDLIEEEKNIVIDASLSVWAGNILVMKTKTCKAQ
jgi:hypothetical protein